MVFGLAIVVLSNEFAMLALPRDTSPLMISPPTTSLPSPLLSLPCVVELLFLRTVTGLSAVSLSL